MASKHNLHKSLRNQKDLLNTQIVQIIVDFRLIAQFLINISPQSQKKVRSLIFYWRSNFTRISYIRTSHKQTVWLRSRAWLIHLLQWTNWGTKFASNVTILGILHQWNRKFSLRFRMSLITTMFEISGWTSSRKKKAPCCGIPSNINLQFLQRWRQNNGWQLPNLSTILCHMKNSWFLRIWTNGHRFWWTKSRLKLLIHLINLLLKRRWSWTKSNQSHLFMDLSSLIEWRKWA